jgi:hypothetical protein
VPDPPQIAEGRPLDQVPKLLIPVATPIHPGPRVVAYVKPAPPSFIRRVLGTSSDGFTPANPLDHPLPPIAPTAPSRYQAVELAAKIDRNGKVVRVKTLEGSGELARISASTLSQWRFQPARQNGEPVDSEMLVRFELSNTPR